MRCDETDAELLGKWVNSLLTALDDIADHPLRARLIRRCGRTCAAHHDELACAETIRGTVDNTESLLAWLNREVTWCGAWRRRRSDGAVVSVCDRCGCPLVSSGLVELSPALCESSRGFIGALFETALGRPVAVQLERAIGHGDDTCVFAVRMS